MKMIRILVFCVVFLAPVVSAESADAPVFVFEELGFQFDPPTTGSWSQLDGTTMGDATLVFERVEPFALFMVWVSDFRGFTVVAPTDDFVRGSVILRLESITTTMQLTSEDQHELNDLVGLRLQFEVEMLGDTARIIAWILKSDGLVYELLFVRPRALGPAAAAIEADGMFRRFTFLDSASEDTNESAPQQGTTDP